MAASKKRRVVSKEEKAADSDDSNNSAQDDSENEEIVEVDFEARAPDDSDFQGIKRLLQQLFLKSHINLSELSNLLIQQNYITSVIKQGEPDEMEVGESDEDEDFNFGVFSVVNISENKNMECVKQLKSLLLDHCKDVSSSEEFDLFKKILENNEKHVGLIISERFLNIPPKISVPLYERLSEDMEEARSQSKPFNFSYYILISKLLNFDMPDNPGEVMYANAEEELFEEDAQMMFEFSVSGEQDTGLAGKWSDEDSEGQPKRKIMLLPASKWDSMLYKLKQELSPGEMLQ